jgi:hypothetical protein
MFTKQRFDHEEFRALLWKKPDEITVKIRKTDDGYYAKLTNYKDDNVATQARTGEELVEMVNEVLYDYLNIPAVYRRDMGYFMPDQRAREAMKVNIPAKYLEKDISLVTA